MRPLCGRRLGCSLAVLSPVLLLLLPLLSGADPREAALEAFGLHVFQSGITAPDFTATDVHGQIEPSLEACRNVPQSLAYHSIQR